MTREAECRANTEAEVRIMERIPPHRNVLRLYSFASLPEAAIVVMQLATGGDTLKLMQERALRPLPEADARRLFRQLLAALQHLHNHGLVHRDVKCENLLLTGHSRRHLLLADFGYTAECSSGTLLNDNVGSLHYTAPEILGGDMYFGPPVDIWSAGVVLYAWTTGRLPFGGQTTDELVARVCHGEWIAPAFLSLPLRDLLQSMIERDVQKRATLSQIWNHPWVQAHAHHHHHHHRAHHHHHAHHTPAAPHQPALPSPRPHRPLYLHHSAERVYDSCDEHSICEHSTCDDSSASSASSSIRDSSGSDIPQPVQSDSTRPPAPRKHSSFFYLCAATSASETRAADKRQHAVHSVISAERHHDKRSHFSTILQRALRRLG